MPLTQEMLGNMPGLSLVQINRTITQMKKQRLVELQSRIAVPTRIPELARIADFMLPASPICRDTTRRSSAPAVGPRSRS